MVSIHVIDIENVIGTATPSPDEILSAHAAYTAAVGAEEGDHWMVASSHICAKHLWLVWPQQPCAFKVRSGRDGADYEILDFLSIPQNLRRAERLVLASGDGIFAPTVDGLVEMGMEVLVVSRPEALSRALAAAATDVLTLRA